VTEQYPHNLSDEQVKIKRHKYGANILPQAKSPGVLLIFLLQFKSPFIYVLLAAATVSYALSQFLNAYFILAVLIINALIGTVQEYSAERAATALKKMVPSFATVVRNNQIIKVNAELLVPGDLVLLVTGDKVPADMVLCTSNDLQVNESLLTGESLPVSKFVIPVEQNSPVHDSVETNYKGHCFAGTSIMSGRASGQVIATGGNTEIGKIAADVKQQQTKPPLLKRVELFTRRITYSIIILITMIFIITLLRGDDLATVFLLAVALAVSAIPEGLPAAITIALAIGMRRMAKVKVIIRNLLAVEALGSCTYIASDKTGTLTVNEMTIDTISLAKGGDYQITGQGVDLHGEVTLDGTTVSITDPAASIGQPLVKLALAGILANESRLVEANEGWVGQGDMVDVAFLVMAGKLGIDYQQARQRYPELTQLPYESERGFCASINRIDGCYFLMVKGSVEKLLEMSGLNSDQQAAHEKQMNDLASRGYRVLGLACKALEKVSIDSELTELNFLGMVSMIDPLRAESFDAVSQCYKANIKVAMITGDHPNTALALARQAGIADSNMQAVTGIQLEQAYRKGKEVFRDCINSTKVFARVSPHQKKLVVEQIMEDGEFVAVTGDGVNDAPALSNAHVGVAMGLRGTDVARESADLILTDDNFASIVQGIIQGRIVYKNIRKVIFLLISTGAAEIMLVILSLLFGTPLPLFPLQLLWLNLVTNGIQDIALAFEPAEGNELTHGARKPSEPIFNRLMIERVLINAVVMGCIAFSLFSYLLSQGMDEFDARNMTLLLMVLFENVHVLNSRSETLSIFKQYFFGNKLLLFGMLTAQGIHIGAMYFLPLADLLQIKPVTLEEWFMLLTMALILIVVDETHKLIHQRKSTRVNISSGRSTG
jgi:magnesium-transporting ATPase (P-type)